MAFKPRTIQAVLWTTIVVAFGILMVLRVYRRQASIERLAYPDAVFADQYQVRSSGAGDAIIVDFQPEGGKMQPNFAQVSMPHGFQMRLTTIVSPFLKTGSKGSVLITLTNQPPVTPGLSQGAAPPAAPVTPHTSKLRITTYTETPSKYIERLCRFDLASHTLEPLTEHTLSTGFAVLGNDAYWIDPRPEIVKQIHDANDFHTRFVRKPSSLLKVTNLISHTTRTICSGMDLQDDIRSVGGLIYWIRLEAYSDRGEQKTSLWAYVPGYPAPVQLSNHVSLSLSADTNPPVLADGRILWLDYWPDASPSPASPGQVMQTSTNGRLDVGSIQPDGAGKRVELSFQVAGSMPYIRYLQEDAGRAYCVWTGRPGGPRTDVQQYVCLLQPGARQPLRRLFSLPSVSAATGIHDGYIYYTAAETDMEGVSRTVYYRRRLR